MVSVITVSCNKQEIPTVFLATYTIQQVYHNIGNGHTATAASIKDNILLTTISDKLRII